MSLLSARLEAGDEGLSIVLGCHRLRLPGTAPGQLRTRVGEPVVVGARPEHVTPVGASAVVASRPGTRVELEADAVHRRGAYHLLVCPVERAGALVARAPGWVGVKPGDRVELVVDTARLSLFDPASGGALWHGA
jgi:hypothetical protein